LLRIINKRKTGENILLRKFGEVRQNFIVSHTVKKRA
jgi:hypothetical protein